MPISARAKTFATASLIRARPAQSRRKEIYVMCRRIPPRWFPIARTVPGAANNIPAGRVAPGHALAARPAAEPVDPVGQSSSGRQLPVILRQLLEGAGQQLGTLSRFAAGD